MPATYADRLNGVETSLAIKAPVRVATTANIPLSGLQTIDGVTVVADDRVLVKNQTTGSENGIYVASSTTWERAKDFNGARDVRDGTLVYVTDGTSLGALTGVFYQVTTANPIVIGTTSITFAIADVFEAQEFVDLAEDWATKTNGIVDSTDYSAKAWAIGGTGVTDTASRGAAKEWAIETASTVDGTDYSAKEWAKGTQVRGIASGGSAKDWANYTGGTVDNAEYSAKYYAQQAQTVLAAGIYDDVQDKSADYTIVAADEGDLFRIDTSGGNRTITLTAISTLGDFKCAVVKYTGDANTVTIQGSGGNTINGSSSYVLDARYETVTLIAANGTTDWLGIGSGSAGSSFRAPDIFSGDGSTLIFTLSADPGSENAIEAFVGGLIQDQTKYSVSGTTFTWGAGNAPPSGTNNFVVSYKGGTALDIGTPGDGTVATAKLADGAVTTAKLNAGVVNGATTVTAATNDHVLIADTSDSGNFKKALVSDLGPSQASTAEIAAESVVTKYISPDRAKYGPGFAKAWLNLNGQGTIATRDSYGVSSVSDDGAGEYGANLSTAFANTGYHGGVTGEATNIGTSALGVHAAEEITNTTTIQRTTSVFPFVTKDTAMADADPITVNVVMHGDI